MSEQDDPGKGNWVSTIMEGGGVPQSLAKPARKAISRLIGATVDIPAAWLEGQAQAIRDKVNARSHVSQELAKQVAQQSVNNQEIIDRAMNSMIDRAYRVQRNKDAIAKVALEDLKDNPPPSDGAEPSDDWMSKFERYAEDVCSEDLQLLFGKILAGEIRQPSTISPSTLHFVSMLDQQVAQLIERVLPICIDDGGALYECLTPELDLLEQTALEQAGFWSTGNRVSLNSEVDKYTLIPGNKWTLVLYGEEPGIKFSCPAAILSRAGKDLLRIIAPPFDFNAVAKIAFRDPQVCRIDLATDQVKNGKTGLYIVREITKESVE